MITKDKGYSTKMQTHSLYKYTQEGPKGTSAN